MLQVENLVDIVAEPAAWLVAGPAADIADVVPTGFDDDTSWVVPDNDSPPRATVAAAASGVEVAIGVGPALAIAVDAASAVAAAIADTAGVARIPIAATAKKAAGSGVVGNIRVAVPELWQPAVRLAVEHSHRERV